MGSGACGDPHSLFKFTKQEIKEGIDFGAKRTAYEAVRYATDPYLIGKGKQLVKEGIEYSVDKAGERYKQILKETMEAAPGK